MTCITFPRSYAFSCPSWFTLPATASEVQLTLYNTYVTYPNDIVSQSYTIANDRISFVSASISTCQLTPQTFGVGSQYVNSQVYRISDQYIDLKTGVALLGKTFDLLKVYIPNTLVEITLNNVLYSNPTGLSTGNCQAPCISYNVTGAYYSVNNTAGASEDYFWFVTPGSGGGGGCGAACVTSTAITSSLTTSLVSTLTSTTSSSNSSEIVVPLIYVLIATVLVLTTLLSIGILIVRQKHHITRDRF